MPAVFQNIIDGRHDLRQILITTSGAETFPLPIMDTNTFKGQPTGLLLALTLPAANTLINTPDANETLYISRIQQVGTATTTIKFESRPPSNSTPTFSSPSIPLTSPAPIESSPGIPIFTAKKGESIYCTVDQATTIIIVMGRRGRFSGGC